MECSVRSSYWPSTTRFFLRSSTPPGPTCEHKQTPQGVHGFLQKRQWCWSQPNFGTKTVLMGLGIFKVVSRGDLTKLTRTGCTQRWRCRRWCQAVGENDLIPKWLSFSTWIYHQSWSPCSHQKCGLKQQPRGNMCVQPSNPFPAITPIYLMLIKESANSECLNHGFYRFKIWDYSTFQTLLKKHDATFQIDTYECRSAQLAPNHTVNQTLGLQLSAGN